MVQRLYLKNSFSFQYILIINQSYVLVEEYYFKWRQTPLSKGSEGSQPLTRTAASKHALSRGRCGRPGAGTVQRHTDIDSSVYTYIYPDRTRGAWTLPDMSHRLVCFILESHFHILTVVLLLKIIKEFL